MELFGELVGAFGRRLGIPALAPEANGGVDLMIERVGRLQLEECSGCLLATLARPIPARASGAARTLLSLVHWRENHPWPIHPGMKGGEWMTMTVRVPLPEADVPALEGIIDRLAKLLDAAERAG